MLTTFVVLVVLAVLGGCYACERRRRASFERRFPPISDAEFVARCRPGTDPAIALRVRRVLADCLCVDHDRVEPSSRLIADLGAE